MNGCKKTEQMDSSFAGGGGREAHGHKHDTTEDRVNPVPFSDQDLPNHNEPQACARVPGAGLRLSRPARSWARTHRAGTPRAAGSRALPRPRGLRSPAAQRCAPGPAKAAQAAESRLGTANFPAGSTRPMGEAAPWVCRAASPSRSRGPARARFLCGEATPPSPTPAFPSSFPGHGDLRGDPAGPGGRPPAAGPQRLVFHRLAGLPAPTCRLPALCPPPTLPGPRSPEKRTLLPSPRRPDFITQ